jgi:hypothetical protein
MKLKVYGWQGFHRGAPGVHKQVRFIVAASSQAAAARSAGYKRPSQMFCLGETGNPKEIEIAMAEVGVVFWAPRNSRDEYRRLA